LSIVIDEFSSGIKQVHFLPFNKANRDEEFADLDGPRTAAAFSVTKVPTDNNVKAQFATLKTYMDNYRVKAGKKTEEFKVVPPTSDS
jgi:hypothetical protein